MPSWLPRQLGFWPRSLLFLAGFFGVLILWLILCHTLNLVAKLPGLHLLNKLLGGLLGLIKGLLLLMVARWILCDLLGGFRRPLQRRAACSPSSPPFPSSPCWEDNFPIIHI